MKVRLEEGLQLVVTPESYVEQLALGVWVDKNTGRLSGMLIEVYKYEAEMKAKELPCFCENVERFGHSIACSYYVHENRKANNT